MVVVLREHDKVDDRPLFNVRFAWKPVCMK